MPDRRRLVDLTAASWAALAVAGFASPDFVTGAFDQKVTSRSYRGELRGVYGGMATAIATALLWANRQPVARRQTLRTLGWTTGGIGVGRLVNAAIDGRLEPWPNGAFMASELAMAALLLSA